MRSKNKTYLILKVVLLFFALTCFHKDNLWADEDSKYLEAVREFADNVLKYGRDTYGPKHTPLFVDGVNVNTHEPVKWINPKGDLSETTETEEWILSNLALQQNLLRTLDNLTAITGDPKYRQAAMEAIAYAFENLRTPNGLLHWGEVNAYDAGSDRPVFRRGFRDRYSLKAIYPYYRLMWEVDQNATEELIETIWAAHIHDWSNLDLNRIGPLDRLRVPKGWDHEYEGGPVYFQGEGISFCTTGGDLCYAACMLSKLSGKKKPLVWAKRIAHRYVETRDPRTGFWDYVYSGARNAHPLAEYFEGHTISPVMADFGGGDPANRRPFLAIYLLSPGLQGHPGCLQTIWYFTSSELLGEEDNEFKQWALEELTARGKVAYRKEDNFWIPMLADGTNIEGFVCPKDICAFARKGSVIKAWQADLTDFWAYALGYRVTSDSFLWEMARNIIRGNSLGDIGAQPGGEALLNMSTDCHNAHALLGFLCLYERTKQKPLLDMAKRIGDNILADKFHKGFFVASNQHIYARFEVVESLSLLHLFAAIHPDYPKPPSVWPSDPRFVTNYRYKEPISDIELIYNLTESNEPPLTIGEAAAIGDTELVRSLIAKGADVNYAETCDFLFPLYRAVENGHLEVVKSLLSEGADVQIIGDWRALTPLHLAAEKGHKEIAELLIAHGADVNAKSDEGRTPIDIAMRNARMDIASVLIDNGAEASFFTKMRVSMARTAEEQKAKEKETGVAIHTAVQSGNQQKVKALLDQGADINAKDDKGNAILHYAVRGGYKELVDLLVSRGADVNLMPEKGYSPLHYAVGNEDVNTVKLLVDHGAQFNEKDPDGWTTFYNAVWMGNREIVDFLVSKGADISTFHMTVAMGDVAGMNTFLEQGLAVDTKDEMGCTPLFWATCMGQVEVVKLLIAQGADVNLKLYGQTTALYQAAQAGDNELVELLLSKGADVNARDKRGRTPLFGAASAGHSEAVELLIAKGADVNARTQNRWTPLHRAVAGGHGDIVELLLVHGADMNVKGRQGNTPLDLATRGGFTGIVEILTKAVEEKKVDEKATTEKEPSSESPDMPAEK